MSVYAEHTRDPRFREQDGWVQITRESSEKKLQDRILHSIMEFIQSI